MQSTGFLSKCSGIRRAETLQTEGTQVRVIDCSPIHTGSARERSLTTNEKREREAPVVMKRLCARSGGAAHPCNERLLAYTHAL